MKRYQLLVLHVVALFALAGCSNDDITQDKGTQESEDLTGMTEFAVKETPASTSTRTMGILDGNKNAYNLAFRENVVGIYVSSRLKGAMTIAFE